MTYSVRNIVVATLAALTAAVVVLLYTSSFKEQVTRDQQRVEVLVAQVEIPAGTAAEKAAGSMELREILASNTAPGALTSTAAIGGKVATQTVFAGQQVVADVFQQSITQAASLQLAKTQRGVRLEVDMAKGVLGAIKPGDTVDVFGTFTVKTASGDEAVVTRLLLTDVRVLEAPDTAEDDKPDIAAKQIVMLSVSQRDAGKLAFMAAGDGDRTLQLVVRPPKGQATEMPIPVETLESMIMDGLTAGEIKGRLPQIDGSTASADAEATPSSTTTTPATAAPTTAGG